MWNCFIKPHTNKLDLWVCSNFIQIRLIDPESQNRTLYLHIFFCLCVSTSVVFMHLFRNPVQIMYFFLNAFNALQSFQWEKNRITWRNFSQQCSLFKNYQLDCVWFPLFKYYPIHFLFFKPFFFHSLCVFCSLLSLM